MFYFNKTVKAFKKDCDSFRTPYDGKNVIEPVCSIKAKKRIKPLRIAACTVVAAALVLTGAVWIPKAQQSGDAHSFEIVAYAADNSTSKVTLVQDAKINLPHGTISYNKKMGSYSEWMEGFLCSGKNLNAVTYSCKYGILDYGSKEIWSRAKRADRNSIVCTIKVPASKMKLYSEKACFTKLCKSGELDKYLNKYFKDKSVDLKRYYVTVGIIKHFKEEGDGFRWVSFGGYFYNKYKFDDGFNGHIDNLEYEKKENYNKAVIVIQDVKHPDFGFPGRLTGKSVTVKATDHNQQMVYDNGNVFKKFEAAVKATGKMDYSLITGDTVTVKAKFKDGKVVTKYIHLSYNKAGKVCAKLTDK